MGKIDWKLTDGLSVAVSDGQLVVNRSVKTRQVRAMHGLVRAELSNIIQGVTKGYEKSLEITGVGYKAQLQGREMSFNVGYINPVPTPCLRVLMSRSTSKRSFLFGCR